MQNKMIKSLKSPILIVLIAGIGDLVLASTSIRALRTGFPDADIHLLTSTEASILAKNYEFVDHVWAFPIRELRHNKLYLFNILTLIKNLRKTAFSSVINLYMVDSVAGALKMGLMLLFLKSEIKFGHGNKGFSLFLTKKAPRETFQNRHLADAMMDIAILAGGVNDKKGIEVFWDKDCEWKWNDFFLDKLSKKIIGINPGGDRKNKRWNPYHYAVVADRLIEEFDASIVILGGHGEEEISLTVQNSMKNEAANLAGKLSLDDLAYIISRLDLLVTNDSGPMHIGAATKTPLIAIFGPDDPLMTRPYTSSDLYRLISEPVHCRPCNKDECDNFVCLDLITPDMVFEKCAELLQSKNQRP
jgi:lipopolysaccharide heptosyltransferase II